MNPAQKNTAEQQISDQRGEILISGLDTGPSEAERENRSPTVKLIALEPATDAEPEDEDG